MDASVAASLEAEAARLRSELAGVADARVALAPDLEALAAAEQALGAAGEEPGGDDGLELDPALPSQRGPSGRRGAGRAPCPPKRPRGR